MTVHYEGGGGGEGLVSADSSVIQCQQLRERERERERDDFDDVPNSRNKTTKRVIARYEQNSL